MNKTILIIGIIVVVLVGGYFIYKGSQPSIPKATLPTGPSMPTTPEGQAVLPTQTIQPAGLNMSVSIKNFAFNPATLTVKTGTTVVWTNDDSAPHQIKSDNFNSLALSSGQSFSFLFSTVGQYDYSCAIHPSMKGKIIVTQ
jgi:plastocyanin